MCGKNSVVLWVIFFLTPWSRAENPEPPVPLRSHQTDHTKQFEYRLNENHQITYRSLKKDFLKEFNGGNLEDNPHALNWNLFDKQGVPYKRGYFGRTYALLQPSEFLSEIAVASEILVAVSNTHRVYLYKPTVLERPIAWSDKMGAPFEKELYLPAERRAWSFSCSVRDKAIRRVDFMDPSERVIYYSDQNGTRFDFGFTATIYVLLSDGQRIVYWDTGLPPSFSRGFLTPLNGTTQGQSLSAAGSTIFISVLDSTHTIRFFTLMYDYEINGACPGLTFTYESAANAEFPTRDGTVPLGFGERKLPLEGWREHILNRIPEGHVGSQVSIHLTGQGNAARELRIQGTDLENRPGYYFKGIDEVHWTFQPDERVPPLMPPPFPYDATAPQKLRDYEGKVIKAKKLGFQVSLHSFHPFLTAETPSTLVVSYQGETTNIMVHSVDEWSLSHHRKHYEDLIGVQGGEPKPLQATIVLNSSQLDCQKESVICQFIQKNFLPYHKKVNAFQLAADNAKVYFRSNDGQLKFVFSRLLSQEEVNSSYYMKKALQVTSQETPTSREKILEMIALNKKTLCELVELNREYRIDNRAFAREDSLASTCLPFAPAAFLFSSDPTYTKAIKDLKAPFKNQADMEWSLLSQENQSFRAAIHRIRSRIFELQSIFSR